MNTVDAQTMEKEELDIWDSWPVQDAVTGVVSNWDGYQLVVAMAGAANKNSNHIYLLYNEYGNNDFANWRMQGQSLDTMLSLMNNNGLAQRQ